MARRSNLVLLGWLVGCAAVLVGCAADTYSVGDDLGWTIPPAGQVAYGTWARFKGFKVGDTITFNWTGTHSVAQVTKDDYDNCNVTNNMGLGPVQTTSPYSFILNSTAPQYFICTVDDHCSRGQKVTIEVRTSSFSAASPSLTTSALSVVFLAAAAAASSLFI